MPRRLDVKRPYPQLTVSPAACRRNGWRAEVACVRCLWFFEPQFGARHAAVMDRDFEQLWTKPGFKCSRCGRWPKTLRVWRPRARPVLILQLEGPKEHHG